MQSKGKMNGGKGEKNMSKREGLTLAVSRQKVQIKTLEMKYNDTGLPKEFWKGKLIKF